ncbi:hypothetical protein Acr_00g0068770 [Actinidia rufa]|uniref:Retroviral polymerase SH3-like domain-containing protein n=1 Tax=Actinidia rufa TaxID=165716 RepID=A0A7J0DR16_9ERIC|nr:hypothetical protein Acr_00g0068770 [Actinidia rufa]
MCYVHALDRGRDKLDPCTIKCVFLGYSRTQKGIGVIPLLLVISLCVDVTFNESLTYFTAPQPSPPPNYYLPTLVPVAPPRQEKPLQESCKVVANLPENRESALLSRKLVGNAPQSRLAGAPIGHGWCDGWGKQSRHVRVVIQFMSTPRSIHWEVALRIIRYLRVHPGRGIMYRANGHLQVEAFTDANRAGSPSDKRLGVFAYALAWVLCVPLLHFMSLTVESILHVLA